MDTYFHGFNANNFLPSSVSSTPAISTCFRKQQRSVCINANMSCKVSGKEQTQSLCNHNGIIVHATNRQLIKSLTAALVRKEGHTGTISNLKTIRPHLIFYQLAPVHGTLCTQINGGKHLHKLHVPTDNALYIS